MTLKLGECISELRKSTMTQNALSVKVGVTQHYISLIEKGKRKPNRRLLAAIIDIFIQEKKDVSKLLPAFIQDSIPGSKCETDEKGVINVVFQGGLKQNFTIEKKLTKMHDPEISEIVESALEDLTLRDALLYISRDTDLKKLIKDIVNKARTQRMVIKLSQMKEKYLLLMESFLENLLLIEKTSQ